MSAGTDETRKIQTDRSQVVKFGAKNMAGYSWQNGMSNNAVAAYASGELPASKAAKEWGFKSAAAIRRHFPASSYHHTSKFFNSTDFYDIEAAVKDIEREDVLALFRDLTKRGKEIFKPILIEKMFERLADCKNYRPRGQKKRKFRRDRLAEFGLSFYDDKITGDLTTEKIQAYKKTKDDEQKNFEKLRRIEDFKRKLIVQRDCSKVVKRKTNSWEIRVHILRQKCGNHGANFVETALKDRKLSLTEKNWRRIHAEFYVSTPYGYERI